MRRDHVVGTAIIFAFFAVSIGCGIALDRLDRDVDGKRAACIHKGGVQIKAADGRTICIKQDSVL